MKGLFLAAGCTGDHLTEQAVPRRKQPNIICELPGTTDQVVVVGAHFDHVDAGMGVIDNWSGAALLPSLYQALTDQPRKYTYRFIGFTSEESGEIGSRYYVDRLSHDDLSRMIGMINMDSLGLGPTEVWASQSDPVLISVLSRTAKVLDLTLSGRNVNGFGESDEESFIRRKICTLTVHSLTPETAHVLHSPADNPSAVNFPAYFDTYRLLAAYLAVLDITKLPDPHVCSVRPVS